MRWTGVPDENRCWFAWRVVDVRRAYDLTIDRREADALDAIFETCPESSTDTLPACPNFPTENKRHETEDLFCCRLSLPWRLAAHAD